MKIYNLSKGSREALAENLGNLADVPPLKSKDLKVAEGDDSLYEVLFDSEEKIYLGFKRKNAKEDVGSQSDIFPVLMDQWLLPSRPIITVDSGAVKFVVGGANIMRPGITKVEREFGPGEIVLVKEEKFGKGIAVGRSKLPRYLLEEAKKGAVIENLHYVGDKFWQILKEIH